MILAEILWTGELQFHTDYSSDFLVSDYEKYNPKDPLKRLNTSWANM